MSENKKLTKEELEDSIYYTTLRSGKRNNDKLFAGLAPFLFDTQEQFRKVFEELEYIKAHLQTKPEKPARKPRKKKEDEVVTES